MKTYILFLLTTLSTSAFSHNAPNPIKRPGAFESLSIVFETNVTDEDAEIVIKAKAFEGMKRFVVIGPTGKKYHDLHASDLQRIGLAQLVLESGEPSIATVKSAYPEGVYTFFARTVSGAFLFERRHLNHAIATPPQFSPCDEEGLDPNAVTVTWAPATDAVAYELELENDDLNVNMTLALTGDTTQMIIPPNFLRAGTAYDIGVTSVTQSGNKSVSECSFTTAE